MRNLTATLCLTLTLFLGSIGVSESADFQKGYSAYQSGDYATALREWTPLAKQGDAKAQSNLGLMYSYGQGVPQDYKTAVKWWKLAAKQGDASAQTSLGAGYAKGNGVLQDYKTAVKWYRLAAEQGNTDAQNNLGGMYERGRGVIKDFLYGHMWWNIAASSGHKNAVKNRDIAAKRMMPFQLEIAQKLARKLEWVEAYPCIAQKLARECVRKKYKGC